MEEPFDECSGASIKGETVEVAIEICFCGTGIKTSLRPSWVSIACKVHDNLCSTIGCNVTDFSTDQQGI